jgi:tRNA pseudouridine32 synthase
MLTDRGQRRAIRMGRLRVNGEKAGMDTRLRGGDLVTHVCHRHEPPVTAQPIEILHQDADVVVVNKPASVPVHACGKFFVNTVVGIMQLEFGLGQLHRTCVMV